MSPLRSECLLVPAVEMRFTASPSSVALPCCVPAASLAPTEVLVTSVPLGLEVTSPAVTFSAWEGLQTTFDLRGLVEGEEVDEGEEGVELARALMLLLLLLVLLEEMITLLLSVFLSTPIMDVVRHTRARTHTHSLKLSLTLTRSTCRLLTHAVRCFYIISLRRSTGR